MHNEKSYFWTQNGSLAIYHIGVVTIEQYEPAQQLVQHGRSIVNLHRGRATKRYSFLVVSGQQNVPDVGFSWESLADHLFGSQWTYIGALPGKGSNCD